MAFSSAPFHPTDPHIVDTDPAGIVTAMREALAEFEPEVARLGKRLHTNLNPVVTMDLTANGFVAAVERADDDEVETAWTFDVVEDEVFGVSHECTCDFGSECEHGYAAALKFLELLKKGQFALAKRLKRHGTPAPASAGAAPKAPLESPIDRARRECVEQLKRKLTAAEETFLSRLHTLHHSAPATGGVSSWHFRELGLPLAGTPLVDQLWATPMLLRDWWAEKPASLLEFAAYLALFCEPYGVPFPAWIGPLLPMENARLAAESARVRAEELRWQGNFAHLAKLSAPTSGSRTTPFPAEFRLVLDPPLSAHWECRLEEGADWSAPKAAQMKEWLKACTEPAAAVEPAARALRDFKERGSARYYRTLTTPPRLESNRVPLEEPEFRSFLLDAVVDENVRALVVTADEEPIQEAPDTRWHFSAAPGRPGWVRAEVRHADGTPLGQDAIIQREPPRAIDRDRLVRLPKPLEHTGWPIWTPLTLPASALRDETALNALHGIGSVIEPELLPPHEVVPLKLRFDLQTAKTGPGSPQLRLAVSAVDADGQPAGTWSDGRWLLTPRVRKPGAPLRIADASGLSQVGGLVRALRLKQDYSLRLQRAMTNDAAAELAGWIDAARAAGAEITHSSDLAGLFRDPLALQLKVEAKPVASPDGAGGRIDWFDVQIEWQIEDVTLTPAEVALLLKANGRPVNLPGRGWQKLRIESRPGEEERLRQLGVDPTALLAGGRKETMRLHALQFAGEKGLAELVSARQQAALRRRLVELRAEPDPALPPGLTAELRPYQADGFRFLAFLSRHGLGGVLADDMGLGKTVQALAWVLWLHEGHVASGSPRAFRVLVVCPKSVLHNWERETARFTPGLRAAIFRPEMDLAAENPPALLAANYAQLRHSADAFKAVEWDAVILDEAQAIKNPTSQTAQLARELRATHRLALTGTPIENRLLDLWSIFGFALPGLLGTRAAFGRLYGETAEARTRLAQRVRPFLLRRTKAQVAADLPARIEEDLVCDLEPGQRTLYDAELKRARAQLLKVKTASQLDGVRFTILQSLLRLRQICCDPRLVGGEGASAKLDALFDTIEPLLEEGHKVLVFSQFVRLLELLRTALQERGHRHWWLTGETEDRSGVVDAFQEAPEAGVFLLSLKAAGTGLNLTAASYVVLFDPWWNPAVEAQAIDRTHRIGQKNQVIAYRLLARDTVEEKIRLLQRSKAALAGSVVQEDEVGRVMDLESLRFVLG